MYKKQTKLNKVLAIAVTGILLSTCKLLPASSLPANGDFWTEGDSTYNTASSLGWYSWGNRSSQSLDSSVYKVGSKSIKVHNSWSGSAHSSVETGARKLGLPDDATQNYNLQIPWDNAVLVFWLKTENMQNATNWRVGLESAERGYDWCSITVQNTQDWTLYTIPLSDFDPNYQAGDTIRRIKFANDLATDGQITGDYWVDGLKIVPEPATIGLISLGLIGFLRRK